MKVINYNPTAQYRCDLRQYYTDTKYIHRIMLDGKDIAKLETRLIQNCSTAFKETITERNKRELNTQTNYVRDCYNDVKEAYENESSLCGFAYVRLDRSELFERIAHKYPQYDLYVRSIVQNTPKE